MANHESITTIPLLPDADTIDGSELLYVVKGLGSDRDRKATINNVVNPNVVNHVFTHGVGNPSDVEAEIVETQDGERVKLSILDNSISSAKMQKDAIIKSHFDTSEGNLSDNDEIISAPSSSGNFFRYTFDKVFNYIKNKFTNYTHAESAFVTSPCIANNAIKSWNIGVLEINKNETSYSLYFQEGVNGDLLLVYQQRDTSSSSVIDNRECRVYCNEKVYIPTSGGNGYTQEPEVSVIVSPYQAQLFMCLGEHIKSTEQQKMYKWLPLAGTSGNIADWTSN